MRKYICASTYARLPWRVWASDEDAGGIGINAFVTDGGYEVWRTDTGMSSGMMSGPLEVLEVALFFPCL
jgi:hypothetical protein